MAALRDLFFWITDWRSEDHHLTSCCCRFATHIIDLWFFFSLVTVWKKSHTIGCCSRYQYCFAAEEHTPDLIMVTGVLAVSYLITVLLPIIHHRGDVGHCCWLSQNSITECCWFITCCRLIPVITYTCDSITECLLHCTITGNLFPACIPILSTLIGQSYNFQLLVCRSIFYPLLHIIPFLGDHPKSPLFTTVLSHNLSHPAAVLTQSVRFFLSKEIH